MAKKTKLIPEDVCGLTEEEQLYISRGMWAIPYDLDIIGHSILVPPGDRSLAEDNLFIQHYIRLFGFSIKEVPGAVVKEIKELKIKHTARPKKVEVKEEVLIPKVGLIFLDTRNNIKQKIVKEVASGKKWEIMIIGTMQPNYPYSKETFLICISNGFFKPLQYEQQAPG